MENKQNVRTMLRIPKDVYAIIVKLAAEQERSINGELVYLLKVALEGKNGKSR